MAEKLESQQSPKREVPPLEQGDHLDQPTFHQRYLAMPRESRAELIAGRVHMPSPTKGPHGRSNNRIDRWLGMYEEATPGTEAYTNTTTLMGPESEPQPDACLLIASERGGQTSLKDGWIVGPPELIVEVASSTEAIDLHERKRDYERCGVREYLVLALRQERVYWFVLDDPTFVPLDPGADGIFRSRAFPGLWLDAQAFLAGNMASVREVLATGLASADHAAFVSHLETHREASP